MTDSYDGRRNWLETVVLNKKTREIFRNKDLTTVATTGQLARHQVCSDDEATLRRAVVRGSSEEPGVSTNVQFQDLDLLPGARANNRRVEVVAVGLPSSTEPSSRLT